MLLLSCSTRSICPIFQVSNVTGAGLSFLKMFLNLLNTRTPLNSDAPAEFQIDETYQVPVSSLVPREVLTGRVLAQLSRAPALLAQFA